MANEWQPVKTGNADTTPLELEMPESLHPNQKCILYIRESAGETEIISDPTETAGGRIPAVSASGEMLPAGDYKCTQKVYLYAASSTAVEYVFMRLD
jgi:hypothetical protein